MLRLIWLMRGIFLGFITLILLVVKPLTEAHKEQLKEKDSIYFENLNFQDSIYRKQVKQILTK